MDFDKQRNEYILNYLENDKTNTALLMKGSWGIGKTYYIKESLIPFLKSKGKKVVLVSLYGIKDAEELSKYIFTESYFKFSNSKGGTIGIGIAKTVIRGVASHFNVDLNGGTKEWKKLTRYANLRGKLLIVDDLERHDSSFEVTEILGYINNLCENDGIKVLLVGDENALFGLNDGEKVSGTNKYKLIKEKTIGDTLLFVPNFEEAVRSMLKSFELPFIDNENEIKIIKGIVEVSDFKEINSRNLRAVSRACQKMSDMLNKYRSFHESIENEKWGRTFFENVFLGLVAFYFRLSKNSSIKFEPSGDLVSSKLGTPKYPLYRFSYDFHLSQFLQESDGLKAYLFLVNSIQENENNEVLNVITSYYCVTESQLVGAMNKLKDCLKSNGIRLNSYSSLATYLIAIEHQVGLVDDVKEILSLMEENIRHSDIDYEKAIELKEFVSGCELVTKEEQEEFDSFVNAFIETSEGKTKAKAEALTKESLMELLKDANKNRDQWMVMKKGYSAFVDFKELFEFIKSDEASAYELNEIRGMFMYFYNRIFNINEYCFSDLVPLKEMKEDLEKIKDNKRFDKTKHMQIKWFIGNINQAISNLERGGKS